ncbi:MAG TPA: molybdopterin-binding protein [Candidatus Dormibacteraeota bacterium]|jgi:molybdenum cofactor synthesis domain-containing protein|nr:molybdopterin-binding protein [Candidatus Dormibacteraeota bacterium]
MPSTMIVAVGDELLGGFTLDTNSHWLAQQVREAGYPCRRIEVVADEDSEIVAAIERAVGGSADRIFVCGGLGPTTDDRTLQAVAHALRRPIGRNPEAAAHIQGIIERMHAAGWVPTTEVSEANARMAEVPDGAVVVHNRRGMASGLAYQLAGDEDRWLFVLPGVPREFQAIVSEEILPRWMSGSTAPTVRELHYGFAIEASFYEPMQILEREFPDVSVGSYPQTETRRLIIRIRGGDPERVDAAARRLLELRPLPAP